MSDLLNDRNLKLYFDFWERHRREMQAVWGSSELAAAVRTLRQPIASSEVIRRFEEVQANYALMRERLGQASQEFERLRDQWRQAFGNIQDALRQWKPAFDAINEALRNIPEWVSRFTARALESCDRARECGWFFQPEFDPSLFITIAECETDEEVNKSLEEAMETCVDEIEVRLCEDCPERSEVIREAFSLYREARYIAAIPLLMVSADGIAQSKSGKAAFNAPSKGKPKLASWINEQDYVGILYSVAAQFAEGHPLAIKRKGIPTRHEILHGADVRYGTKTNALRAMSFLGSLAWILLDVPVEGLSHDGTAED